MKLALFFVASVVLAAAPNRQFVVISDIHFNPLADPALAPQLIGAEPAQWEQILSNDSQDKLQQPLQDSSWGLLSALVTGVQNLQPRPELIVLTGDILPHKFQTQFAAAAQTKDPAAFRAFVQKTVAFITLELQKAAAGVPLIYTLGNNDEECGDYALQPGGPFLQDMQASVQKLAHLEPSDLKDWPQDGSYTAPNPLAPKHRIIALNSNFWSRRYTNTCGDAAADPGAAVLTWLSTQLQAAQQQRQKVWLVYHIPPGIDGHSSAMSKAVLPFWKPVYSDAFYALLDRYRDTIELNLAGHTHLDDIRLVKTDRTTTLVFINPGVSTNIGQNPAFRVFTVDSRARLKDLSTYYIKDLASLQWQLEYSEDKLNEASYEKLYQSALTSDAWKQHYFVSHLPKTADDPTYWKSLYCATGNVTAEGFSACLKSTQ